jgi:uncharacterized membrane protein
MYRKDPREAAVLGIVFVGLGHFYLGMWLKGIALILITVIVVLVTTLLVAPVFWIISGVWAYYDAKSYNRAAGYREEEVGSEEDEEEEVGSDEDEEEEVGSDEDEEEEVGSDELLVKELRAIHSTIKNGFAVVAILLLSMIAVMVYLLLHFTRLVLAP